MGFIFIRLVAGVMLLWALKDNPFLPLYMDRHLWSGVDIAAATLAVIERYSKNRLEELNV